MKKTNAMRMLTQAGITFRVAQYAADPADLSAQHAAELLRQDLAQVFKTLVLKGQRRGYFVCCVPGSAELDLKKAAAAAGDKRAELLPLGELLPVTGYLRGGCSPVGMKKQFPTLIDETATRFDEISVSAGVRGASIFLDPNDLIQYLNATVCDLKKEQQDAE
jgi:Cys-tRNA(Pro)/Cys-tRNA(Cys) deacylase